MGRGGRAGDGGFGGRDGGRERDFRERERKRDKIMSEWRDGIGYGELESESARVPVRESVYV